MICINARRLLIASSKIHAPHVCSVRPPQCPAITPGSWSLWDKALAQLDDDIKTTLNFSNSSKYYIVIAASRVAQGKKSSLSAEALEVQEAERRSDYFSRHLREDHILGSKIQIYKRHSYAVQPRPRSFTVGWRSVFVRSDFLSPEPGRATHLFQITVNEIKLSRPWLKGSRIGDAAIVAASLDAGADPHTKIIRTGCALCTACKSENKMIVERLISNGASLDAEGNAHLMRTSLRVR